MKQHNVHVKNGEAQGWHTLYNDHFVTTLIQQLDTCTDWYTSSVVWYLLFNKHQFLKSF